MHNDNIELEYDVAVIGAGMTGMSASLFAANRGLSVIQCGSAGGLQFASGLLDLIAFYPFENGKYWKNPWFAIEELKTADCKHPYQFVNKDKISTAFEELLSFFKTYQFAYCHAEHSNSLVLTGQGSLKPSYFVPESMWNGVKAFEQKEACLIVDFEGMKEISAHQVVENMSSSWSGLRHERLVFPGMPKQGEIHPEHMARSLENKTNLEMLAELLKRNLQNETVIGLPAVMGLNKHHQIFASLQDQLGVKVFEIPTPAVSISGLRIKELCERYLPGKGVKQLQNSKVKSAKQDSNGNFHLQISHLGQEKSLLARNVVLASGRFFGGGLKAGRNAIYEGIFDLPVVQPESRSGWHHIDFFSSKGHPVNQSGVEVDARMRPLDKNGEIVFPNLFAAGAILAHQDWIREKSGSGIAVSTAYAAVESICS